MVHDLPYSRKTPNSTILATFHWSGFYLCFYSARNSQKFGQLGNFLKGVLSRPNQTVAHPVMIVVLIGCFSFTVMIRVIWPVEKDRGRWRFLIRSASLHTRLPLPGSLRNCHDLSLKLPNRTVVQGSISNFELHEHRHALPDEELKHGMQTCRHHGR